MAEFEELRLTVNLVDNASAGLTKIRTEIGQLTNTASAMTTGLVQASASIVNFGTATQTVTPKLRTISQEMRELNRAAADTGRALGQLGMAAQQGLSGLPQMAMALYQATGGVVGLGEALQKVAPAARISALALGGIAVGIVAVGAAVVAYGVSVFRFAKEMDQLNRTARTMGMTFAELKNAQDQAKAFGSSAEVMIRSFQGIQDAQLDLYKNNSQLRQKLIGQGVDANWVNQLAAMDPTKAHNAIVSYGKALEKQALEAGVGANVARAIRNQFNREFGLDAEAAEIEIMPPTPEAAEEMRKVAALSKEVMDIWNPLSVKLDRIKLEALKAGLPYLKRFLDNSDEIIATIKRELDGLVAAFKEVAGLYRLITKPIETIQKGEGPIKLSPNAQRNLGLNPSQEAIDNWQGPPILPGGPRVQSTPPTAPKPPGSLGLNPLDPSARLHLQSYQGGDNDNTPHLIRAAFSTEELTDETGRNTSQTEKLTSQLEKLNAFFDRMENRTGVGGGGAASGGGDTPGVTRASLTTGDVSPSSPPASAPRTSNTTTTGSGQTPAAAPDRGSASTSHDHSHAPAAPSSGSAPPTPGYQSYGNTPFKVPEQPGGGMPGSSVPGAAGTGGGAGSNPMGNRLAGLNALMGEVRGAGMTTTSGFRGHEHSLSQANRGSAHTQGLAFDTRARTPEQVDAAMTKQRELFASRGMVEGRDYKFIDEVRRPSGHATGPHLHTQLTPEGMRRYQQSRANEKSKVTGVAVPPTAPGAAVKPSMSDLLDRKDTGIGVVDLLDRKDTGVGGLIDRGDLDRTALSDAMRVRADGSVKVDVNQGQGPTKSAASNLFRDTPLQRSTSMPLTDSGPSVDQTRKEYVEAMNI